MRRSCLKRLLQPLLSLSLPAEFKQKHLSEVLLLGEIKDAAAADDAAKLNSAISQLKQAAAGD